MALTETLFRIDHSCLIGDIFRGSPDSVATHWCNNGEKDVFEIKAHNLSDLKQIRDEFERLPGRSLHQSLDSEGVLVLVRRCCCYKAERVTKTIIKIGCLLMPPVIYSKGWEHYKVISFNPTRIRRLFKELDRIGRVEVLSKTHVLNAGLGGALRVPVLSLFSKLTTKQLDALLTAVELGYYRLPSKVSMNELARRIHVSRSTYGEHLKKTENKIMLSVAPYLRLLRYGS